MINYIIYIWKLFLLIQLNILIFVTSNNLLDKFQLRNQDFLNVIWQFQQDNHLEGWKAPQINDISIYVRNDNLHGTIIGENIPSSSNKHNKSNSYYPGILSPPLFLSIEEVHYLVIRMKFLGMANLARILLKTGSSINGNAYENSFDDDYWTSLMEPKVLSDSGAIDYEPSLTPYSSNLTIDSNRYTYFLSKVSKGANIIYDMGSSRWLNTIEILNLGEENNNSSRKCLLQKSLSSGVGPFQTVITFALNASFDSYQTINGFRGFARYWRLVLINNYGGKSIGFREIRFSGLNNLVSVLEFPLTKTNVGNVNTNEYTSYVLPIGSVFYGKLLQFRLEFIYDESLNSNGKLFRDSFLIEYAAIAKRPEITMVIGCIDKYSIDRTFNTTFFNVTTIEDWINNQLQVSSYVKSYDIFNEFKYAMTFDCSRNPLDLVNITIKGYNFGISSSVTIDSNPCPVLIQEQNSSLYDGMDYIICSLPPVMRIDIPSDRDYSIVRVENNFLSGLFHEVPYLQYRIKPPAFIVSPIISNIAACKVDISWIPPGNPLENLVITGYVITWFNILFPDIKMIMIVSNITTTSVRGLLPQTEYVFAIATLAEGSFPEKYATLPTDLYGRRALVNDSDAATQGDWSPYSSIISTLVNDFEFHLFNANNTLNHSSAIHLLDTNGPTGNFGSEGHYGLIIVGDANIQNCNVSSTCCDDYNSSYGFHSCQSSIICAVSPINALASSFVVNGISRRELPSNIKYTHDNYSAITIQSYEEYQTTSMASISKPSIRCGSRLRLTPSFAKMSGSAWYPRKMNVYEGFETTFQFEISNPSFHCNQQNDVNTFCRSRGADGFAFIIQNSNLLSLGDNGAGLGYQGIPNSLAIEFDTFHNYDNLDFYENHVAVMTRVSCYILALININLNYEIS